MSWMSDMQTIISADELAKDVAGAEALLERHQEHKVSCLLFFFSFFFPSLFYNNF